MITKGSLWPARFLSLLLLAWAIYIHICFIRAVPDPVFHPDSSGYVLPAFHLLFGHSFDFAPERTPAYPMFLYTALKTTHSFFGVLILQHLLVLLTGMAAAGLYYRYFGKSLLSTALIFFFSTALPVPAVYAHCILTETLYTFFVIGCVLLFLLSQERRAAGWGFAAGLTAFLAILTRPVGKVLLGVFFIAPFFNPGERQRRVRPFLSGLTVAGLLLGFCTWNAVHNSYFGVDRFGGLAFFGTTARYLNPDTLQDPALRETLKPVYAHHAKQFESNSWVCYAPDGPVSALRPLYTPGQLDHVLKVLSGQAIRQHPYRFLRDQSHLFIQFFWSDSAMPLIYINREYTFFLYRGLQIYDSMSRAYPGVWDLLRYGVKDAQAYTERIRPLAAGQIPDAEAYLDQIDQQDVYHYYRVIQAWGPLRALSRGLQLLPLLACLLSIYIWRLGKARNVIGVMWGVIGVHGVLSALAAGMESRYTVPVLPLYWVLVIGGLQQGISQARPKILRYFSART